MSERIIFSRARPGETSPHGPLIADLQSALNAVSTVDIDVDGQFGSQTEAAIRVFQTGIGLEASGEIGSITWNRLMNSEEPSLFERCLSLTASFEGTGFTRVVGNFDGAGLTWGIIGFTLVHGELGAVLEATNRRHPQYLNQAFGADAAFILQICGAGSTKEEKLHWANSVSRGSQSYAVAEPWRTYFATLGSFPEVQKLQIDRASQVYWKKALSDGAALGLSDELDFALMYDIAVQNGGLGPTRLKKAKAALVAHQDANARERRNLIGEVVAASIGKYQADVRSRKTAIADGKGKVHGGAYDLGVWGLSSGIAPLQLKFES